MPLYLNLNLPILSQWEYFLNMCEVIVYSEESLNIDEHVEMLIRALSNVSDDYIGYDANKDDEKVIKYAERVFAYELYHQFRSLMDDNCGCYLNAEIKKDSKILEWEAKQDCYPDLVLHGSPIHIDPQTQYFLCEIKMDYNNLMLNDLDKLAKLFDSNLHFQHYISLFIGVSKEELKRKIENQIKERKLNDKTLCICRKKHVIEVFKLDFITLHKKYND